MGLKRRFIPIIACGFFWVACGESSSPADDDPATTGNPAIDEIISAYCGTVRSCCGAAGYPPGPIANCESVLARLGGFPSVLDGKVVLLEPERTECVAWLESLAPSCLEPNESPCERMFDGTATEGEPCEEALECHVGAAGVACLRAGVSETRSGVCRALGVAQLGAPCFMTINEDGHRVGYTTDALNPTLGACDRRAGFYCSDVTSTCQPLTPAGAPCEYDDCADGLYCDGTCLPKVAAGTPCEVYDQCEGDLSCVDGVCGTRRLTDGDLCEGDLD